MTKQAMKIIDNLNNQLKYDKLAIKITNRIMFEKGIAFFVGRVHRRLQTFIENNNNISNLVHDEFYVILKYCFHKYELHLLTSIRRLLSNEIKKNCKTTNQELNQVQESNEFKKLKRFLEMDIKTTEIKIIQGDKIKIQSMKNKAMFYPPQFKSIIDKNSIFDQEIKDLGQFEKFLNNLVLDFISYFGNILTKVKLNDMSTINNPEIKKLLSMTNYEPKE